MPRYGDQLTVIGQAVLQLDILVSSQSGVICMINVKHDGMM